MADNKRAGSASNRLGHQREVKPRPTEAFARQPHSVAASSLVSLHPPIHPLLLLQRQIGNRAVRRLLQGKFRKAQPDDGYEQEADRVTAPVMRVPALDLQRWIHLAEKQPAQSESLAKPQRSLTSSNSTNAGQARGLKPTVTVSATHPEAQGIIARKAATPDVPAAAPSGTPTAAAASGTPTAAAPGETSVAAPGGTTKISAPAAEGPGPTAAGGKEAAEGGGQKAAKPPIADPAFQETADQIKDAAEQQKTHDPAKTEAAEAQDAAQPPDNEVTSKAQDRQVDEMSRQEPGQFDAAAFEAAVMQKVAAAMPNTLGEADEFKQSGKLDNVKSELSSQVASEKQQAASSIETKTKATPDKGAIPPKTVIPLPPPGASPQAPAIEAAKAAPKPKPPGEISLEQESQKLDQQMAEAEVTEEQLKKSNEPKFQTALSAKQDAQAKAAEMPNSYRQSEQATLAKAQAGAQSTTRDELQAMQGVRQNLLARVTGSQHASKGKDEQARTQVADKINDLYAKTKEAVETILGALDGEVTSRFEKGATAAKQKFEAYVASQMENYKKRYQGPEGWVRWLTDKLLGVPPEVNAFFHEGKKRYLSEMGKTIKSLAEYITAELNKAKQKIIEGKQSIQSYVESLPIALRQVGQEAAEAIQGNFDELEQSVDNKQEGLIELLAQKYQENLERLDEQINEMKAANRGWLDAAADAVGGVIKEILELKEMLTRALGQAAAAVELIIKDPIGFLGNLVAGVKQGFLNFLSNIETHLKAGLIGWLTGTVAAEGIQLPEQWDAKGLFSLIAQILGLTYQTIRQRVVKAFGEKVVIGLEKSFEIFKILVTQGLAGLWQFLKDKVGDLKTMVMDGITSFVSLSIVKAGVMWVLSLLSPASAFVRACKLIVDVVMFFVERASQIAGLANAILNSVSAIASGAIGAAASQVESALSKSLPVVLSFLASLVGLGGISGKIQEIFKKAKQPVEKGLDWLFAKVKSAAKKIADKLKLGKIKEKAKSYAKKAKEKAKEWAKKAKAKVKSWVDKAKAKVKSWVEKAKEKFQKIKQIIRKKFGFKEEEEKNEPEKEQEDNKKTKEQKAQERLDKAAAAIRPQLEQMLAHGSSKLVLRAKLLYWRVRYRLSALNLDESGQIVARVNPEITLFSGVEVANEKLGRLLQYVFKKAEKQFEKELLKNTEMKERYNKATREVEKIYSEKFKKIKPPALERLPRALQIKLLRHYIISSDDEFKLKPTRIERYVIIKIISGKHLGKLQVTAFNAYDESEVSILKEKLKRFSVGDQDFAEMIQLPPNILTKKLDSFKNPTNSPQYLEARKKAEDEYTKFKQTKSNSREAINRAIENARKAKHEFQNRLKILNDARLKTSKIKTKRKQAEIAWNQAVRARKKAEKVFMDIKRANKKARDNSQKAIDNLNKVSNKQLEEFRTSVKSLAFLTHGVEPARQKGVGFAHYVASTLIQQGVEKKPGQPLELDDLLTREGEIAPMTPEGASSADITEEVKKKRHERIGNIFATLVEAVEKGPKIVGPSGADLGPLVDAIRNLVESYSSTKLEEKQKIKDNLNTLIKQVKALMAAYNGVSKAP